MGQKLLRYYEIVGKEGGGLPAQMRLAMKTCVSQEKAASEPDSTELLGRFQSAVKDILGKEVSV